MNVESEKILPANIVVGGVYEFKISCTCYDATNFKSIINIPHNYWEIKRGTIVTVIDCKRTSMYNMWYLLYDNIRAILILNINSTKITYYLERIL